MIAVTPNRAMPTGCCARGRRCAMMVCAVGIIAPPVKPWPTRPMIIIVRLSENPQMIEKVVNKAAAMSRNVRRPSSRSNQAAMGMMTISATR